VDGAVKPPVDGPIGPKQPINRRYTQGILSPITCVLSDKTAAEIWDGLWHVDVVDGEDRRALWGHALVLATGAYTIHWRLGILGGIFSLVLHRMPLEIQRKGKSCW
jgi:hypothetical protein